MEDLIAQCMKYAPIKLYWHYSYSYVKCIQDIRYKKSEKKIINTLSQSRFAISSNVLIKSFVPSKTATALGEQEWSMTEAAKYKPWPIFLISGSRIQNVFTIIYKKKLNKLSVKIT